MVERLEIGLQVSALGRMFVSVLVSAAGPFCRDFRRGDSQGWLPVAAFVQGRVVPSGRWDRIPKQVILARRRLQQYLCLNVAEMSSEPELCGVGIAVIA